MRITIQLDDVTEVEHTVADRTAAESGIARSAFLDSDVPVTDAGPARLDLAGSQSGEADLDAGSAPTSTHAPEPEE